MEELLLAVTSLKRDFQERKLSRVKQDQSVNYEYRLSLLSPKLNSTNLSEVKSPGRRPAHQVPLIRIPPKGQDEFSRYLQSTPHSASITKSSPARSRSYKLDAAGLLMSRVKKFIGKHFALWRQNADKLRHVETKMMYNKELVFKVNIMTKTEKPRYVKAGSDDENLPKAQTSRLASRSPVVFDFDLNRSTGKKNLSLEVETNASPAVEIAARPKLDYSDLYTRPASTRANSAFKRNHGLGLASGNAGNVGNEGNGGKANRLKVHRGESKDKPKMRNGILALAGLEGVIRRRVRMALEEVWMRFRLVKGKGKGKSCLERENGIVRGGCGEIERTEESRKCPGFDGRDLGMEFGDMGLRAAKGGRGLEKGIRNGVTLLNKVYLNHISELFYFMKFRCVVESGFFEESAIVESSQDNLKDYIESIEKKRKNEKSCSHKSISYLVNAPSFVNLMADAEINVLRRYFGVLVKRLDRCELACTKLIKVLRLKFFEIFYRISMNHDKKIFVDQRKIKKLFKCLNSCHKYLVASCFAQWKSIESHYDPFPLQIITLNEAINQISRRYKRELFKIYSLSKSQRFRNAVKPLPKSLRFNQGLNLLSRHISYIKKKVFLKLSLPIQSSLILNSNKQKVVSFIYYQLLHKIRFSLRIWKNSTYKSKAFKSLSILSLSQLFNSFLSESFSKLKLNINH